MKGNEWLYMLKSGLCEGDTYHFLYRRSGVEARRAYRLEKMYYDFCVFSYKSRVGDHRIRVGLKYDDVRDLLNGATMKFSENNSYSEKVM